MAETAVASFVAEKLGNLLLGKVAFFHGVQNQVEEMKKELNWIQCSLRDAESKLEEERDQRFQLWVSELREVAYDIEDVIDSFMIKIQSHSRKSFMNKLMSVFQKWNNLRVIGNDIEAIQTRIRNISNNREKYNEVGSVLTSAANESTSRWRRLLPHTKTEELMNGLDESTVHLVAELMKVEEQCRVIPIIGMGGLGKTTLAFKIYNHPDIKIWFDCRVWVYVSKQFNLLDILHSILISLNGINKDEMDIFSRMKEEQLLEVIYVFLESKRYLVVLDDLWSTEAWDVLQPAFPHGQPGSKIMLTSRNSRVALHADSQALPYKPPCLTEEGSWALFCQKAFPGGQCPDSLTELGKEMVRKCAGLPLAIVVLGGLMGAKKSSDEWVQVRNNISWHLSRGEDDRISKILALSYHDLPHHLKLCFLYFSHFPLDSNIRVRKLIRLWVAEGFIPQGSEETIEVAAENCLKELIARCMVQVVDASFGAIKVCQIHDVLWDFSVAKSKAEKFLEILSGTGCTSETSSSNPRRQAIHSDYFIGRHISLKSVTRCLRSLLIVQGQFEVSDYKHLNFVWKEFKLLRILDLGNLRLFHLPADVGNLIHLRYLGLKGSSLKEIPKTIGNLRSLQTLDLRSSYSPVLSASLQLPDVIWKMEGLRHLLLNVNYRKGLRIDTLRNLQTLLSIKYGSSVEQGLIKLVNLRKLGVYDISAQRTSGILNIIVKLFFLRSLSLSLSSDESQGTFQDIWLLSGCRRLLKLYLWGRIQDLPHSDVFPPSLTKLTLHASQLEQDPMEVLGKLPNLVSLQLNHNAYRGKELICNSKSFPRLQNLRLLHLYELEEWTVVEGAMPASTLVEIWDCKNLNTLPVGLRFITTLQKLVIAYMPKDFTEKVQAEDELFKIQHIPSVTCY